MHQRFSASYIFLLNSRDGQSPVSHDLIPGRIKVSGIFCAKALTSAKCPMSFFSDLLINYMHPSLWFLFCSLFHPELDHLPNSPVLSAKPQTAHSPENLPAQHNTYHTSAHSKSTIEPTLTQHNQAVLP
jgi:hypothetical protein